MPSLKEELVTCKYTAAQLNNKPVQFNLPSSGRPAEARFNAVQMGAKMHLIVNYAINQRKGERGSHVVTQEEADKIRAVDLAMSSFILADG